MTEITIQGFPRDAALLEILRKHIPEPQQLKNQGVTELQFYNQLQLYWDSNRAQFAPFDAKAMAADVNARLVQPLARAQALFDRFEKLTRLTTFISPEEMTSDPLFMQNNTLPDVPVQRTSNAYLMCGNQQYTRCQAPVRLELPDGQKLYFKPRPNNSGYCYDDAAGIDRGMLDKTSPLEVAYQRDVEGEGAARINNRPAIDGVITEHNAAARAPVVAGGAMGVGGSGSGNAPDGGAGGSGGEYRPPRSGCAVGGVGPSGALVLLVAGAGVALSRRRRRGSAR
jgi:MYXO-CTERM domain-containing protein